MIHKLNHLRESYASVYLQGIVTLIGPIEPFATGIKIKSKNQHIILP